MPHYSVSMMQFICENNVLHEQIWDKQDDIAENFSEDEIFRILKYLAKYNPDYWEDYWEYITYCRENGGTYLYGITPKKNMREISIEIKGLREDMENVQLSEAFSHAISKNDYQNLVTEEPGFQKSKYMILAPQSPQDLCIEASALRNCLHKYRSLV